MHSNPHCINYRGNASSRADRSTAESVGVRKKRAAEDAGWGRRRAVSSPAHAASRESSPVLRKMGATDAQTPLRNWGPEPCNLRLQTVNGNLQGSSLP
jgi:hypothetical protein